MTERELILLLGVVSMAGFLIWQTYFVVTNDSRSAKKPDSTQDT